VPAEFTVAHVGAWGRNYGDRAIQHATMALLQGRAARRGMRLKYLPVDCQAGRFDPWVPALNDTAHLVLVGGGGLIWDRPGDSSCSGWQWNVSLEALGQLRMPFAVHAIGNTRFPYNDRTGDSGTFKRHMQHVWDMAASFSVRNSNTAAWLTDHIATGSARVPVVPCPAHFLAVDPTRLPHMAPGRHTIGLVWAGDQPHMRYARPAEADVLLQAVVDQVAMACKATDTDVLLLEHIAGLDHAVRAQLRAAFDEHGIPLQSVEEARPDMYPARTHLAPTFFGVHALCDVVVSMRKHGLIVPAGAGVPVVGLGALGEVWGTAVEPFFPYEPCHYANTGQVQGNQGGLPPLSHTLMRTIEDDNHTARTHHYHTAMGYGRGLLNAEYDNLLDLITYYHRRPHAYPRHR
jgi:hypothetical protein